MDNLSTAQNKTLPIMDALKNAWKLVHGLKWPVFSAYLIGIIAIFVINIFIFLLSPTHLGVFLGGFFTFVLGAMVVYIDWFVIAMLVTLGVRQAMNMQPNTIGDAFSSCIHSKGNLFGMMVVYYLGVFAYIFLWAFLTVLSDNGTSFLITFILGAIFTAAAIYFLLPIPIFALPLLITTRCGIFEAIKKSYPMFHRCWFRILASLFIMLIILTISAIPLGIGLIWTIPMVYALIGIWFREMSSL